MEQTPSGWRVRRGSNARQPAVLRGAPAAGAAGQHAPPGEEREHCSLQGVRTLDPSRGGASAWDQVHDAVKGWPEQQRLEVESAGAGPCVEVGVETAGAAEEGPSRSPGASRTAVQGGAGACGGPFQPPLARALESFDVSSPKLPPLRRRPHGPAMLREDLVTKLNEALARSDARLQKVERTSMALCAACSVLFVVCVVVSVSATDLAYSHVSMQQECSALRGELQELKNRHAALAKEDALKKTELWTDLGDLASRHVRAAQLGGRLLGLVRTVSGTANAALAMAGEVQARPS